MGGELKPGTYCQPSHSLNVCIFEHVAKWGHSAGEEGSRGIQAMLVYERGVNDGRSRVNEVMIKGDVVPPHSAQDEDVKKAFESLLLKTDQTLRILEDGGGRVGVRPRTAY